MGRKREEEEGDKDSFYEFRFSASNIGGEERK